MNGDTRVTLDASKVFRGVKIYCEVNGMYAIAMVEDCIGNVNYLNKFASSHSCEGRPDYFAEIA